MNIFCGVQATGRGHLSRFAVIREMLLSAGHDVYGYATGQELPPYAQGIGQFDPGPTFYIRNNRMHLRPTVSHNLKVLAALPSCWRGLKRLMKESQFDRAVIDFEPVSARAICKANVPLVIFDNQTLTLTDLPAFAMVKRDVAIMRRFVKLYYGPALMHAEKFLTYSLAPVSAGIARQTIIPPCVRKEVAALTPNRGDHILFYSSIGEVPHGLMEFAKRNPNVEVRAYVSQKPAGSIPRNIVLPDRNNAAFLTDFATCRAYVANAGFESIAEAVVFDKPLMVVPIGGQWEQRINCAIVNHYGIGSVADNFTAETFERALRLETCPPSEVRHWVSQGREMLQNEIVP